jgi:hypothetical protein
VGAVGGLHAAPQCRLRCLILRMALYRCQYLLVSLSTSSVPCHPGCRLLPALGNSGLLQGTQSALDISMFFAVSSGGGGSSGSGFFSSSSCSGGGGPSSYPGGSSSSSSAASTPLACVPETGQPTALHYPCDL